jgi:hypothetical protein
VVGSRSRQAGAGGPTSQYKLLGLHDPVVGFIVPEKLELIIESGSYRVGDVMELDQQQYQVLSKRHLLFPVAALHLV